MEGQVGSGGSVGERHCHQPDDINMGGHRLLELQELPGCPDDYYQHLIQLCRVPGPVEERDLSQSRVIRDVTTRAVLKHL